MRIRCEARPTPRFYVAFIDILGFRRLVMRNRMPRARSLDHKRRAGWWHKDAINDMYNPIGKVFTSFHQCFERAVDKTPWETEATALKKNHVEEDTKLIELPTDVACKAASHEWNLLSSASEMGGVNDPDFDDQENRLLKHLQSMMKASPVKEQHHYLETIESLKKMVRLRDCWIPDPD